MFRHGDPAPHLATEPNQDSEEEFRRAVHARDPKAWGELAARYAGPLERRAQALLLGGMDAENAVGQTWLYAFRYAHAYNPRMPTFPWLASICTRICVAERRRVIKHHRPSQFVPRRGYSAPPDEAAFRRRVIRIALADLPPADQLVLTLRFLLDLPSEEVARILRIDPAAARQRTSRAAKRLRASPHSTRLAELVEPGEEANHG